MINGEKAAYCTPTFAEKRERTLGLLLKGVEQKCNTEVSAVLGNLVFIGLTIYKVNTFCQITYTQASVL